MSIEDNLCGKCWGRGHVARHYPGQYSSIVCDRCKGTGEEPSSWNPWVVSACVVILVVFFLLVWSIPHG